MTRTKVYRYLWVGVLVAMLSSIPQNASAHSATQQKPSTTSCVSYVCLSYGYWLGTTYGAGTNVTVSQPGLTHQVYGNYWNRTLSMCSDQYCSINAYWIGVGMEVDYNSDCLQFGCYCGAWNKDNTFHLYAFDFVHSNQLYVRNCVRIPQNDVNIITGLQISRYTGNGGGQLVQFNAAYGQLLADFIPFTQGVLNSYYNITTEEVIRDNVNGHEVWGSTWFDHSWFNSNNNPQYQGRAQDYILVYPPPPQYIWFEQPNGNNNAGGELVTCVYDSSLNLCSIGQ